MDIIKPQEEKQLRSDLNETTANLEKLLKERDFWDIQKSLGENLRNNSAELEPILGASGFEEFMKIYSIRNQLQHPDPRKPCRESDARKVADDFNSYYRKIDEQLGKPTNTGVSHVVKEFFDFLDNVWSVVVSAVVVVIGCVILLVCLCLAGVLWEWCKTYW